MRRNVAPALALPNYGKSKHLDEIVDNQYPWGNISIFEMKYNLVGLAVHVAKSHYTV